MCNAVQKLHAKREARNLIFEVLGKVPHKRQKLLRRLLQVFLLLEYLHNMRKWRGLLSFEIFIFNNPVKLFTATIMT
jgi:hypothetical protein